MGKMGNIRFEELDYWWIRIESQRRAFLWFD